MHTCPIKTLIMRMRMLVKTSYYAHHFIKIGLLCSKYARLISVQQYVQCIESIEICSARIANKHAQRRCCKNCDRRSPVVYCFHYTVALQATNKVAKGYLCPSIYAYIAQGRCRTCNPRAPSVGCRPCLAITAKKHAQRCRTKA